MAADPEPFDVVVAGGGMVGASLALALAQLPLRIALVEAVPVDSSAQPSFDVRTTALSRSSQRILEALGLWAEVQDAAWPIKRIHVSERGRFGSALIDASAEGVPALGYVLENRRLGQALWRRLEAASGVTVFCPATVREVLVAEDQVTLLIDDRGEQRRVAGRLLAAADGAHSRLRAAVGISAKAQPYGQTAIVGTVGLDSPAASTAFERFTTDGPAALLPAGPGRAVFVLARRTCEQESVMAMARAEFRDLLQQVFGRRAGRFGEVGERHAYPLELVRASTITAARTAIVGNAAHGLHPVAGQGYNLGLRDVACLAEVVADAWREGRQDPGASQLLARYRGWRQADQRKVVAFTHGLIQMFDLPAPAGIARGLGLMAFDIAPGAKAALARHAMGLGGRLTRLGRGLPL